MRIIFERSIITNVAIIFIVVSICVAAEGAVNGRMPGVDIKESHLMNPGYTIIKEGSDIRPVVEEKNVVPERMPHIDGALKERVVAISTLAERQLAVERQEQEWARAQVDADILAEHLRQVIHQEAIQAADNLNRAAADVYKNMETLDIKVGDRIKAGTELLPEYTNLIQMIVDKHNAGATYKINTDLVKAVIMQESGGRPDADNGSAKGIMQLEYTVVPSFIKYGKETYGQAWTESDRLDAEKCIDYGVYVLVGYLNHYSGDYIKALQAYNYSHYSLDKLIGVYGNDWMENRSQMARLNNRNSYGDSMYVERVLSYYPG